MKNYLTHATNSGREVWTQFGETEMLVGMALLAISLVPISLSYLRLRSFTVPSAVSIVLSTFIYLLAPLSNSYINEADAIVTFSITLICLSLAYQELRKQLSAKRVKRREPSSRALPVKLSSFLPFILLPILCRSLEDFTGGHGQLASLHHSPLRHVPPLVILVILRPYIGAAPSLASGTLPSRPPLNVNVALDVITLLCLCASWSTPIPLRYSLTKAALLSCTVSATFSALALRKSCFCFALATAWMAVTGPGSVTSVLVGFFVFFVFLHMFPEPLPTR